MDAEDLENLFGLREEFGRHEHESEIDVRHAQLPAQLLRPFLQAHLVEITRPMRGDGELIIHAVNLTQRLQSEKVEKEKVGK